MLEQLVELYKQIQTCSVCQNVNHKKALRLINAVNPNRDVFIISQSLAKKTALITGVNFFNECGAIPSIGTGNKLEEFLNKFNQTIYPPIEIEIGNKTVKPKEKYKSIYNSEILLCNEGDRKLNDNDEAILKCLQKGFLLKEINIVKPKLILLMGRVSRNAFFRFFLPEVSFPKLLTDHILAIPKSNDIPHYKLKPINLDVSILPIQHASGENNQRFNAMLKNENLTELIRSILN
jgi:uracil-DNA glycosylase